MNFKVIATEVNPLDVKVGDIVRIEYGDDDNFVNCVILEEATVNEYGCLRFYAKYYNDEREFEFFCRPKNTFCKIEIV